MKKSTAFCPPCVDDPDAGCDAVLAVYAFLIRPLFFLLPAEAAHRVGFGLLRALAKIPFVTTLLRGWFRPRDPRLVTYAMGLRFDSPVGLAAGFDKDAVGIDALSALGFGSVEVGTVTAEAQPGNPEPRLFRLRPDRALINRMGFNNGGAREASLRITGKHPCVVGVNIGKTKRVAAEDAASDYEASARLLGPSADYLVVNVSSPNTPGLRNLQATEELRPLLTRVRAVLDDVSPARRVPLVVKIAPDLADEDVDRVADLALELGLDGIMATNTTLSREGLRTPADDVTAIGAGGLSGAPLRARSLAVLQRLRARVGERVTLISVGGIFTSGDAWERIRAGATLVQVYTAFVYEGPSLPRNLAAGLSRCLDREGFPAIQAAVGVDIVPSGAKLNAQGATP